MRLIDLVFRSDLFGRFRQGLDMDSDELLYKFMG